MTENFTIRKNGQIPSYDDLGKLMWDLETFVLFQTCHHASSYDHKIYLYTNKLIVIQLYNINICFMFLVLLVVIVYIYSSIYLLFY